MAKAATKAKPASPRTVKEGRAAGKKAAPPKPKGGAKK